MWSFTTTTRYAAAMKKQLLIFMLLCAVTAVADQDSPIPWGQYTQDSTGFSGSGNLTGYEVTGTYIAFPVPMKLSDAKFNIWAAAGNIQILICNANGSTGPLGLPYPGTCRLALLRVRRRWEGRGRANVHHRLRHNRSACRRVLH